MSENMSRITGALIRRWALLVALCGTAGTTVAGTISGTVTGPDGLTPVSNLEVTAWRSGAFLWTGTQTSTATNGTYTFSGLADGTYRIEFNQSDDATYAHETYNDRTLLSDGSNFTVTAGSVHSNINASLALASRISGHVYGPNGLTGLTGIWVWAYRDDGPFGWRRMGEFADSDPSGAYTIGGLATGPYRVRFKDEETGDFIPQVYSNASELDSGLDIVLPASETVSNINVSLFQAGKISGRILTTNGVPMSDGSVDVLEWNGSIWTYADSAGCFPDEQGYYTMGGMSSGTYRVKFTIWNEGILDEVYNNALEPEYGRDVTVVAGTTLSNINATLDSAAWPPQVVRISPLSYGMSIAYTATGDAVCVLQENTHVTNDWADADTNTLNMKGVNTFTIFSPGSTQFWRIYSPPGP